MTTITHDLEDWRKFAAARSKGTSDEACHALARRLAAQEKPLGSLLEFGAGTGAFARGLHEMRLADSIICADIMARPMDFPEEIRWIQADLNFPLAELDGLFDTILSIEVIEHLKNPRAVFREFRRLLRPGGRLILTTPNQESLRSLLALLGGRHFASFLGPSYPAHITALLEMDLVRVCHETGFPDPAFHYSNAGRIPKMTRFRWPSFLGGRFFSDNLALVARKTEK